MTTMAVIGCGLIGGSMALSWKKAGIADKVVAFGHHSATLTKALEMGAADMITNLMPAAVSDADIVVAAVPVQAMEEVFSEMRPFLKKDAVITDVGSTRVSVIEAARRGLKERFDRYAPAHPIAGGELPGVAYASADLFENKTVISTPAAGMDPKVVAFIEESWRQAGARVEVMTPEEHDEVFASVSHLPHVLAYALVDMIAREPGAQKKLSHAGAGFRDFTRIASSSPVMWRDICLSNRQALSEELARYRKELEALQKNIDEADADALLACFENAVQNRRGLVFPGK